MSSLLECVLVPEKVLRKINGLVYLIFNFTFIRAFIGLDLEASENLHSTNCFWSSFEFSNGFYFPERRNGNCHSKINYGQNGICDRNSKKATSGWKKRQVETFWVFLFHKFGGLKRTRPLRLVSSLVDQPYVGCIKVWTHFCVLPCIRHFM